MNWSKNKINCSDRVKRNTLFCHDDVVVRSFSTIEYHLGKQTSQRQINFHHPLLFYFEIFLHHMHKALEKSNLQTFSFEFRFHFLFFFNSFHFFLFFLCDLVNFHFICWILEMKNTNTNKKKFRRKTSQINSSNFQQQKNEIYNERNFIRQKLNYKSKYTKIIYPLKVHQEI